MYICSISLRIVCNGTFPYKRGCHDSWLLLVSFVQTFWFSFQCCHSSSSPPTSHHPSSPFHIRSIVNRSSPNPHSPLQCYVFYEWWYAPRPFSKDSFVWLGAWTLSLPLSSQKSLSFHMQSGFCERQSELKKGNNGGGGGEAEVMAWAWCMIASIIIRYALKRNEME